MNKILALFITYTLMMLVPSCSQSEEPTPANPADSWNNPDSSSQVPEEPSSSGGFTLCKGADVSWLTEMEDQGIRFYYDNGEEGDCIQILKSKGINAIRLRVWVNHAKGYNALTDVLAKARRAKAAGMDVMIDFHYSDDWADPSKQAVPAAWAGMNLEQLCEAVSAHTVEVLSVLKDAGITPKWVQVGNETGNGMLWPFGKADTNPAGYARLVNAGYDAVKSICPDAKVIIHLQNGQDHNLFVWLFDILRDYGARYDVIGMSLYPERDDYMTMLRSCKSNMLDCVSRYDKDVMLCEVGMGNAYVDECAEFLKSCLELENEIPANRYLGVLYWEPEVYNDWNGYRKGAFTSQGRPGAQLDVFYNAASSVPVVTI